MAASGLKEAPLAVGDVRERLESWRSSRSRGRIPEAVWGAAVELARVHGVNPVAKALRLDYYDLKHRVAASGSGNPEETSGAKPAFVEVQVPAPHSLAECRVKVEDRSGTRLTVEMPASCAAQIVRIARAMWRRGR